jgi:glycosyltransferase involved in cell wall biosynthesis
MKKFHLITDAWTPQTNGVVTTWTTVLEHLRSCFDIQVVHAGDFKTVPLPTYPEIRIAKNPWIMQGMIEEYRADHIHIATEGPLGVYARRYLVKRCIPFTTSLHTKFPEYVHERAHIPLSIGYRFMRWFHRPALRTMCTTPTHRRELLTWGLKDLVVWGRGVDVEKYQPQPLLHRARPRLLFVGRVAVEKNIESFCEMAIDADKIVVGDGPQRPQLQAKYPAVAWLGYLKGQALVDEYAQADVFVFPSKTDTFGLVMLEANACGTPVAAFPTTGPIDVISEGIIGCLDNDLGKAVRRALNVPRENCRRHAEDNTWAVVAERLRDSVVQVDWTRLETTIRRRAKLVF